MTFVQITFGSTINRQLRNIVSWATSELMVLRYVHTFRAAFWPNESSDGQVKISSGRDDKAKVSNSASNSEQGGCNRTDKDKLATRREIESSLFPVSSDNRSCSSGCIPEVLVHLVGQQAARNGAMKVFEALQDTMLNKVLAYEIMELVYQTLFPELVQGYVNHQSTTHQ